MPSRVVVCPTPDDLFVAGAQCVAQVLTSRSKSTRLLSVALSGGSTPQGLFAELIREPYRSRIDWASVLVFWGDERSVPPDHPESNFRMAKEHLLKHLPLSSSQIFRMEGELPVGEATNRYQDALRKILSVEQPNIPQFDLVLLGMGSDAHTASLFPGTEVLEETEQWVAAPWVEKFHTHRITLTVPVFNAARAVVFMVSGFDKAQAAKAVLEGSFQPQKYPAQLINPSQGDLIWLLDQAAASQLTNTPVMNWDRKKGIVLE